MKVIDIDQRLAVRIRGSLDRGQILVREPVCSIGRGRELTLPVVDTLKSVVHRPENHDVRELVFQGLGQGDGPCDVVVRRHRIVPLDFEVRRVPQLRLVIQTDESG